MNIEGFIAYYYRTLYFVCLFFSLLNKMTSLNPIQLKDHFFVALSYQLFPSLSRLLIVSAYMYYPAFLSV